ncbi:MAG: hypothetical protein K1X68_09265 [Saprospiraceae bacterium]|nr:hypothetical protein [Saprospiraceae bacterium]HMW39988.1 hypothetical protein [Saprospiraceae bacterium]HMX89229.1 hypothetical protein [Saprospiraceae bacterium]HMZ40288.1 hypothetical protein [Saprospiraceae bacterium]HNA65134.1 hypothetical protein [Saprospiraceae bacterium]
MQYSDQLLVKDALPLFFNNNKLGDGGYKDTFFKIRLAGVNIPIPNIQSRVTVARLHDIHHLLTGYQANWKGEAEIGAWELRTGCRNLWVAWLLNAGAVMVGLLLYPRAVYSAWKNAANARTNMYYFEESYDKLLEMDLGSLRNRIFNSTGQRFKQ